MSEKNRYGILRMVFVVLGILCSGLGAVGVALPILPTTPFFLAAAFCFARSSHKLDCWFKGTALYKSHLEAFSRGEGMTWPAKLHIMGTVTVVMAAAGFFMLRAYLVKGSYAALYGSVIMAAVWAAHMIAFCFVMKTCPRERAEEIAREREAKEERACDAE